MGLAKPAVPKTWDEAMFYIRYLMDNGWKAYYSSNLIERIRLRSPAGVECCPVTAIAFSEGTYFSLSSWYTAAARTGIPLNDVAEPLAMVADHTATTVESTEWHTMRTSLLAACGLQL